MTGPRYDLEDRLIRFGAAVCRLAGQLPTTTIGKQVTLQVIRSATSPFANYGEVQGAESRRDFIHKLGICLKELRETRAWLKFMAEMRLCAEEELNLVMDECEQLLAILATSIKTARVKGRKSNAECRMSNVQRSMDIEH
jgi:four helix bundle protein